MGVSRESIVCPGCGCLCDDLDATLKDGRLVAVNNVCLWGVSRFLSTKKFHTSKARGRLFSPLVRHRGRRQEVTYGAALAQAGEILARARRPVLYGLTNLGSWAQEAALKLARRLGARLCPNDAAFMVPYYRSLSRHGLNWAPLEVIRDEADTVLFWGANPLHSCPRHLVRYAVFARGRFTERGVEDRQVAGVDILRTELAKFCQLFLKIKPGQELQLAQGVLDRLEGRAPSGPEIKGTGRLADFLAWAESGVIFCGRGISYGPALALFDLLARLMATLNGRARFRLFPLSGDFNSFGLYNLFFNELGKADPPDFSQSGGDAAEILPLNFAEVDAVLVAGGDLLWFLTPEQVKDLQSRQVPIVALSPFANRTTGQARVVFPVAVAGVEAAEIAYRMDGLPVALRQLVPSDLPPDCEVLRDLHRAI